MHGNGISPGPKLLEYSVFASVFGPVPNMEDIPTPAGTIFTAKFTASRLLGCSLAAELWFVRPHQPVGTYQCRRLGPSGLPAFQTLKTARQLPPLGTVKCTWQKAKSHRLSARASKTQILLTLTSANGTKNPSPDLKQKRKKFSRVGGKPVLEWNNPTSQRF